MDAPGACEARRTARASRWTLARALKDPAVEEPVNRWIHRPLAFLFVRPLEHLDLPVTPNHLTLVSGALGVSAAACCYHALGGGAAFTLAGALLLFLSVLFDCADGMLARLAGGGSRFGMLLDGAVDTVVGVSVWYGLSHTLAGQLQAWWVWPTCGAALVSIVVHAALYDDAKDRYLRAAHGVAAAPAPPAGAVERALDAVHRGVYGCIAARARAHGTFDYVDRDRAARELARPMRLSSFIGLGSHLCVVYLVVLLSAFDARAAVLAITLLVTVGTNAVMVVALVAWKRALARLRLESGR